MVEYYIPLRVPIDINIHLISRMNEQQIKTKYKPVSMVFCILANPMCHPMQISNVLREKVKISGDQFLTSRVELRSSLRPIYNNAI